MCKKKVGGRRIRIKWCPIKKKETQKEKREKRKKKKEDNSLERKRVIRG